VSPSIHQLPVNQIQFLFYYSYLITLISYYPCVTFTIYKLYKRFKKQCSFIHHSHIVLQCYYNEIKVSLNWLRLPDTPTAYHYTAHGELRQVKIIGIFNPILTFEFDRFAYRHYITQVQTHPPTIIHLSYLQSFIMRYLLSRDRNLLNFIPVTSYQHQFYAIHITKVTEEQDEPVPSTRVSIE